MSAQFTPGPWEFTPEKWNGVHDDCSIGSIRGGEERWYIATIEDAPEDEANARLIAAAPDLLHACQELIKDRVSENCRGAVHPSGRFCHVCGCNSKSTVHSHGCPVKLAEDAIAKALPSTTCQSSSSLKPEMPTVSGSSLERA